VSEKNLASALAEMEGILLAEAQGPVSEALAASKEAALARLQAALASGLSAEALQPHAARLKAVMAANRFSLKWTGMNARLRQIGQPKETPAPARVRLDLVH
jgi:hypothetical protein